MRPRNQWKNTEEHIQQVKQIIEGDANRNKQMLLQQMQELAANYKFEEAHQLKQNMN